MKKIILALILLLWNFCSCFSSFCQAFAVSVADFSSVAYGYIGTEGAKLKDSSGNIITSLPATYFVAITGQNEFCYICSYLDIEGFVDKPEVEIVDFEPVYKYAKPTFTATNDTHPVNIRSSPTKDGEILTKIPDGQIGIYYGEVVGEQLIQGIDRWYYVRYGNETVQHGYVYSTQVSVNDIPQNVIEKVKKDEEKELSIKTDALEGIFVVTLCIPAVIIMFIIFGGNKKRTPRHQDENIF